MNADVWKVDINLRKRTRPVVTVSGRGATGTILRTASVLETDVDVREAVQNAVKSFEVYDEFEHARAHQLATLAAKSQQGEQEGKVE
jgi:hypothetical protein